MIRTIEELDPADNEDLDAGWDVNDSAAPGISVRQPTILSRTLGQAVPIDEELDAGWDLDPGETPAPVPDDPGGTAVDDVRQLRYSEIHLRGKSTGRAQATVQLAASNAATHPLTKKERRRIERQQRIHAAKKQAETKAERRLQRRQGKLNAASLIDMSPVAVPNTKNHRRKLKTSSGTKGSTGSASRTSVPPNTLTTESPIRVIATQDPAERRSTSSRSPVITYVSIVFALLVLAILYFLAGRRQ